MNAKRWKEKLGAFWELTKPGITSMVLVSTSIGYYLGGKSIGVADGGLFLLLLAGSALSAAGVATLNEYVERHIDGRMRRTQRRPLPSGRLSAPEALLFGVLVSAAGIGMLTLFVHPGTGLLAFITLVTYIFVYTPLKRHTTWNTIIGAIPGAMPPLGGWLAATGELAPGAWALFVILFAWQIPHFLAIATIYRDDYRRGGLLMLPAVADGERATAWHIILFSLLTLGGSLMPVLLNLTGVAYLVGALVLGIMFLRYSVAAARDQVAGPARRLMFASIIYLPALLAVMVADLEIFG